MATMSRAAAARKGTPYQAAVPPQIATMRFAFDDAAVAAAEDARAEVTRFDAELSAMFGGEGEFVPLATVLLRTESSSSSQIENITAGARALALAEIGLARHGLNAELVAANVEAMQRAVEEADRFMRIPPRVIHAALMHDQPSADPNPSGPSLVWIGGSGDYPDGHSSSHAPQRIPGGIHDLCAFLSAPTCRWSRRRRRTRPVPDHQPVRRRQRQDRPCPRPPMLRHGRATTRTTVPVSQGC